MPQMFSPKRRNGEAMKSIVPMPWLNPALFMPELVGKRGTEIPGLLYGRQDQFSNGTQSDDGKHGLQSGYSGLWGLDVPGAGVSETNGADEPRCAICCEFVTIRSSHVCTCQIQSCSR